MSNKAKFDFFEKVKIINPKNKKTQKFKNKLAIIFGKSQNDKGIWYYRLKVEKHEGAEYFEESELESLGTFAKREDYYSGESIRVGVTKDGEGYIIEDDEK